MTSTTARDFCFCSYVQHSLAPAIGLLDQKGEYRDQLFAQTAFVEACWWLNLTIACEYVDKRFAAELFKKKVGLFSISTVKALLKENKSLVNNDLLVLLRHTEPAHAFEEMIFRVKPDFKSPVNERSHLQTALILNGEFERKPGARALLSHALFDNDEEWEQILRSTSNRDGVRRYLTDTRHLPDDLLSLMIIGLIETASHMAAINELFEGLRHGDKKNDHRELENRTKGIMSGRINASSERFRDRLLSTSQLAYSTLSEVAADGNDVVISHMASPDEFHESFRSLMAEWRPEPVFGRVFA